MLEISRRIRRRMEHLGGFRIGGNLPKELKTYPTLDELVDKVRQLLLGFTYSVFTTVLEQVLTTIPIISDRISEF